ncbi:hypothetical protein C8R44DRAFT_754963 [Mycena epipterygia]|nr:hypothetical protein C8R44DRAFT_754963 [Mycena epipterygia]
MAITKSTKSTPRNLQFSRPTILRPMRTSRVASYDALDRWLAVTDIDPDLQIKTPLPDDKAMCEVFVSVIEGFLGTIHRLSLAVYHPYAGETELMHIARFVGFPGDADAPLWTRQLPPSRLLCFSQPRAFVAMLVGGMTNILYSIGTRGHKLLSHRCKTVAIHKIRVCAGGGFKRLVEICCAKHSLVGLIKDDNASMVYRECLHPKSTRPTLTHQRLPWRFNLSLSLSLPAIQASQLTSVYAGDLLVILQVDSLWCARQFGRLLAERLAHLLLQNAGAQIPSYECLGCGTKHREYYFFALLDIAGIEALVRRAILTSGGTYQRVLIRP